MASVFRVILRMSITASYVIAVVIILRMLMKSFSKKYSYCLWSAVLFRLCCPFSFSSVLSLFNFSLKKGKNVIIDLSAVPVSPNFDAGSIAGPVELGAPDVTRTVRETFSMPFAGPASQAPQALDHASDALKPDIMSVLAVVWAAGIAAAAVYALIRYLRLKKELRFSVSLRDNIRQADIRSPFIVGLFRPVIYVPFCGNEAALKVSIEHEKYHIQRKDHWVRALSFCLLCIHWFNPLCWIAYHLMICDMEMSCDEHVISGRADTKDAYVDALLSFATGKKSLVSGRLYFGGSKLKERIKNVMRLKHSGRVASVIAVLICVLTLAACSFNGIAAAAEGTEASIPDLPMIPVHSDDREMQNAAESSHSTIMPEGIYYVLHRDIIHVDSGTNTQSYIKTGVETNALLTDAKRDCLLRMSFSMKDGFSVIRMELDGSGEREIVRLPDHVLTYHEKNYVQTRGSKLYIELRNFRKDVYELAEIDVDAETARVICTFEPGQGIYGGFGNCIVICTNLGRVGKELTPFNLWMKYRFDIFDVDTGNTRTVLETVLPTMHFFSGHNILSMTLEGGKFTAHIYDLTTGEERSQSIDVVSDSLAAEMDLSIKECLVGEALDETHFTFEYPETKMENGKVVTNEYGLPEYGRNRTCLVDAEKGTALSFDDIFADSDVKVPDQADLIAETGSAFYFIASHESDGTLYVVPREQLLGGHVTNAGIIKLK